MLKLSGEALNHSASLRSASGSGQAPEEHTVLSNEALHRIAGEIMAVAKIPVQIAVTIGGGNIWRYRDMKDAAIERTVSDAMGMLATIMNAVALQAALEAMGGVSRVCSAIDVPQLAEPYLRRRAIRHLEKGRIVICAGGTGHPYFTTDSAAALRAIELGCEVILKATNVDGVYDQDPRKVKDAKRYEEVTLQEAIEKNLNIMDQAALSLCREQKLPIVVFNFGEQGNLLKVAKGEKVGTKVSP